MKECPKCQGCYEGVDIRCPLDSCDLIETIPCGCTIAAKYQIEMRLGSGRHGIVYRAEELSTLRLVAIKIIVPQPNDAALPGEFRRYLSAASQLEHDNLIQIIDFGVIESANCLLPYYVMEYAEGWSLATVMRDQKRLSLGHTFSILADIAAGLDYAHARGIVHGALKPQNVWLCSQGISQEVVKLLDCGVSLGKLSESPTNIDGSVNGNHESYRYLSPEQCAGNAPDARSDIYSLAVISYEMLAGTPPFRGQPEEVKRKQQRKRASSLWLWHRVPRRLSSVVHKALAKDPRRRHQSIDEYIDELERHLPKILS